MATPESPMRNHPFGEAARYGDAKTEEIGLVAYLSEIGIQMSDLDYLAQQRAIRVAAVMSQRKEMRALLGETKPMPIPELTPSERISFRAAHLAYLDAVSIGWKAREIAERNEKDANS